MAPVEQLTQCVSIDATAESEADTSLFQHALPACQQALLDQLLAAGYRFAPGLTQVGVGDTAGQEQEQCGAQELNHRSSLVPSAQTTRGD